MSDISNYDYRILDYICSSDKPVSPYEITAKFGDAGRAAASDLVSRKLLTVESTGESILDRDPASPYKLTNSGLVAHQSYMYDRQLETRERWKERIVGYLWGLLTSAVTYLLTVHLIPAIGSLLQTL